MTPKRHLVVFVRAPVLGSVKRRLAAGIGAVPAHRFYVDTTRGLLHRLGRDPRWRCWLAVTPDRHATQGRFWPASLRRLPQGPGDLGRRMARSLAWFDGPTVLVGSDIPELGKDQIVAAFDALGRADIVFGPAEDGGYWLVGVRSPALLPGLFRAVRWSSRFALADTLCNAPNRRIALLGRLADVDDAAALARLGGRGRLSVP